MKYGAQKTSIDGIAFSSKLEAAVYCTLKLRERAGEIKNIRMQQYVELKGECELCGESRKGFKVDFSFEESPDWKTVYCEAKGVRTSEYIRHEKLWKKNPPARLEVWGGNHRNPKLLKVIE